MYNALVESFMDVMSAGSFLTCMFMIVSGYFSAEVFAKRSAGRTLDTTLLICAVAVITGLLGIFGILSGFNAWDDANHRTFHLSSDEVPALLAHAKTRLAWSLGSFAAAAAVNAFFSWVKQPLFSHVAAIISIMRSAISDRYMLWSTLRALHGIEWEETRRHIQTVVKEFLPELRSRQKDLRRQIDRMKRQLRDPEKRIDQMDPAVRDLFEQACSVKYNLMARLAVVDAKIQDCEDFVRISATLADTSPTELSDVTVRFDQLAQAVTQTRTIIERTSEELNKPNVKQFPTRQQT